MRNFSEFLVQKNLNKLAEAIYNSNIDSVVFCENIAEVAQEVDLDSNNLLNEILGGLKNLSNSAYQGVRRGMDSVANIYRQGEEKQSMNDIERNLEILHNQLNKIGLSNDQVNATFDMLKNKLKNSSTGLSANTPDQVSQNNKPRKNYYDPNDYPDIDSSDPEFAKKSSARTEKIVDDMIPLDPENPNAIWNSRHLYNIKKGQNPGVPTILDDDEMFNKFVNKRNGK